MSNTIHKSLEENIKHLKEAFHNTDDLSVRKLKFGLNKSLKVNLIYLKGMVNKDSIQENIIAPLLGLTKDITIRNTIIDDVAENVIRTAEVNVKNNFEDLTDAIIKGNAVILFEGFNRGIIAEVAQTKERGLEQAISERSPRGGDVGLTEKLTTNISLLRSLVKTRDFCIENRELGTISKTDVSLLYIKGVVDQGIVAEARRIIDNLSVQYVMESRLIQEEIDGKFSIFSLNEDSERPDTIIGSLFDGKVIILIDGNPYATIVPGLFFSSFQAPDEYHTKGGRLTIRLLRLMAFIISVYLPAVYVVLDKFEVDNLPKKIAKILFEGNELLPSFWSMVILIVLFTLLIDITFRVPTSTIILVSFVATIIIGETAVSAKIIHPVDLITIGVTFLGHFVIANKLMIAPLNILRNLFLLLGYFFGFNGIIVGTTILFIYMVNLRSLGVPFMSPIIPFRIQELKDTVYRGKLKRLLNSKHSYQDKN
ncbi:spore germination protein [Peribacillus frigoritolerans]|uniref:spore germination protein n=1 Tax=Peribacillus frigoritolerans TaxID=450367 RepID=UPI0032B3E10F